MVELKLEERAIASPSWRDSLATLGMKVVTTFYRRVYVVACPLDRSLARLPGDLRAFITVLSREDLPAYRRFRPEHDEEAVIGCLERGDQCFAAWHDGRIVNAAWVATAGVYVPYLRRDLILHPEDIYVHDSYTLPAYRGQDLAQASGIHLLQHYRQQGYARAVAVVAVENTSGLYVAQATGYRPIGLYRCLRFGGWQRDWEEQWGDEPLPILTSMD